VIQTEGKLKTGHPIESIRILNPGVESVLKLHLNWCFVIALFVIALSSSSVNAEVKTWDGEHSIEQVEVTAVYFLPADREALPDWSERISYYCQRLEKFHNREYGGQSTLKVKQREKPIRSKLSTRQLRQGDADAIFFRTLKETDNQLNFAAEKTGAFPILLVFSEINWRPLDDFYRLKPTIDGPKFEGNFGRRGHFPGATAGGARATFLSRDRKGWGLVSADGWRVPYCGSDCVIYHEGVGHTVGLPHPDQQDGSVMSVGQYRGWLSESWLKKEQKIHLGWDPELAVPFETKQPLFTEFRAIPSSSAPLPGDDVLLNCDWPENTMLSRCQVRIQTNLHGPWVNVYEQSSETEPFPAPKHISLGSFDRPTPVSYRIDVTTSSDETEELWGYVQVRKSPKEPPLPHAFSEALPVQNTKIPVAIQEQEVDLLSTIDLENAWSHGEWTMIDGKLVSPKMFAARIELPETELEEYCMVAIVEPIDEPNAFLLGLRSREHRFVSMVNFQNSDDVRSAIENVDGINVGNITTTDGALLKQNRLTQIMVTVTKDRVTTVVDGHTINSFHGNADRLSLGDYWKTPNEKALFLGTYNCSFRIHRLTIAPVKK